MSRCKICGKEIETHHICISSLPIEEKWQEEFEDILCYWQKAVYLKKKSIDRIVERYIKYYKNVKIQCREGEIRITRI